MIDERTEQLINRKLDGELAKGELLELQKTLIRSPEARALLEECEAMEALAGDVLRSAVARGELPDEAAAQYAADAAIRRRREDRLWLRTLLAAAAVVALFVGTGLWLNQERSATPLVQGDVERPTLLASAPAGEGFLTATSRIPRRDVIQQREREEVLGNILGVYDEQTKSYYLLELDQRDTTVTPVSMNY